MAKIAVGRRRRSLSSSYWLSCLGLTHLVFCFSNGIGISLLQSSSRLFLVFFSNGLVHSHSEDGRSGTFMIGNEEFPASLLDLPAVVESFKTYDDCALVKTADIGQMIMVREPGDPSPNTVEYRHGLTPPMKDARKRRFRREPDLNPELVQRVERDLLNILSGGTVGNVNEQQEETVANENTSDNNANKKLSSSSPADTPGEKPEEALETATNNNNNNNVTEAEPERSESEDSDDSM